jgi:acetyltransferase-like isoleucine patch superfamily enzyme
VSIREFAWIQATSSLDDPGEGLCIGDNTYIGPRSILGAAGGITIGSNVLLGAGVHLLAENHEFRDMNRRINQQGVTRKGIVIEDDVWIGNAAIVLDGVHIGRGAVIGAASVVTRDVSAFTVVAGNPARVIGKRQEMTERTVEKLVSAGSTV